MKNTGDIVYVLEYKDIENTPCYVWSFNKQHIYLFMNQHNISSDRVRITMHDVDEFSQTYNPNIGETDELKPYYFKSNNTNEYYLIYTTECIIDEICDNISDEFTRYLSFGAGIMREDVELFSRIAELIEQLPYANIMELQLLNENDPKYNCGYINGKYMDVDTYEYDHSETYESIKNDSIHNQLQPFTLEAYIHYFVRNIMIPYSER